MVVAIGTTQLARSLDQVRQIRLLNLSLTQQQQQLSNGRKLDGLIGVASNAQKLGDLKAELSTVQSYKDSITQAQNRTRLYGLSIQNIIDVATEAQDLMIKNRDAFFAQTSAPTTQVNTLLDRIGTLLQVKDADRFIFAGRNFQDNPVTSPLSQNVFDYAAGAVPAALTAANESDNNANATIANQPTWLNTTSASATQDEMIENYYYDQAGNNGAIETTFISVYGDDNERVEYGVTAVEPGFQQVVDAMLRFRSALQDINSSPLYTQRVDDARAALTTAITSLKNIASRNGHIEEQLKNLQERHDSSLDVLKTRIGSIENVDTAEIATNIKNLQTSLEASYTITAQVLRLSLVNYLS